MYVLYGSDRVMQDLPYSVYRPASIVGLWYSEVPTIGSFFTILEYRSMKLDVQKAYEDKIAVVLAPRLGGVLLGDWCKANNS